jgi:hypothetical protein
VHVVQQRTAEANHAMREDAPKKAPAAASSAPDPAKLSGKAWWDAHEAAAPFTKISDIADLESDFKGKLWRSHK